MRGLWCRIRNRNICEIHWRVMRRRFYHRDFLACNLCDCECLWVENTLNLICFVSNQGIPFANLTFCVLGLWILRGIYTVGSFAADDAMYISMHSLFTLMRVLCLYARFEHVFCVGWDRLVSILSTCNRNRTTLCLLCDTLLDLFCYHHRSNIAGEFS